MMNNEMFEKIFEEQVQRSRDILVEKAKEYPTGTDRLANFKVAAALQGVSVHQAVAGMMSKHIYSVFKMCGGTDGYSIDQWDEKITDAINYLILLKAVIVEDVQDMEYIWQGLPYQGGPFRELPQDGFPPEVLDEITQNAHGSYKKVELPAVNVLAFPTKDEARKVLDAVVAHLHAYGKISITEVYELIGLTGSFTQMQWGWKSVLGMGICYVDGSYILDAPEPVKL